MWVCLRIGYSIPPKSSYLQWENDDNPSDNPMDVEVHYFQTKPCDFSMVSIAESAVEPCPVSDPQSKWQNLCIDVIGQIYHWICSGMSSTHGPMLWRANAPDFCLSTWWFTPVGKWVIPPVIAGNPAKNGGYTSYTSHLLTRLNHEVCTFPLTKPKGKPTPCGNHQLQPLPRVQPSQPPRVRWDRRKTSWGERIGPSIPWIPI